MDKIEAIPYKGYNINIYYDDSAESPREWDNVGIMELFHNRYHLPSEAGGLNFEVEGEDGEIIQEGWEAAEYNLKNKHKPLLILPIVGYDHGGLSISIGTNFDKWDGGRLGFIFTTAAQCEKMGLDPVKDTKTIEENLRAEVKTYNQYLTGEVYGYKIETPDGEEAGGCWGYYGYDHEKSGLLEQARDEIDVDIEERQAAETKHKQEQEEDKASLIKDIETLTNQALARLNVHKKHKEVKSEFMRNLKSIKSILTKHL